MTPELMKKRIKDFALRCLKLAVSFPKEAVGDIIARQLIRSSTGAAANYRAACIARSRADFVSKLGIVEEEVDESVFWIDFSTEAGLATRARIGSLLAEGKEILAIVISFRKTARTRAAKKGRNVRSRAPS